MKVFNAAELRRAANFYVSTALLIAFLPLASLAQSGGTSISEAITNLQWQVGPGVGDIADLATLTIPEGFVFLDAVETKKFLELNENLASGEEYLLAPESLRWFAIFNFSPVGYVKDDEEIDPAPLLQSVRDGTAAGNVERRKRGWPTMTVLGWRFEPRYDKQRQLLEWAFRAQDDSSGGEVVNYNTRLLGRKGVMEVVLVAGPGILDESVVEFKDALDGYSFASGQQYAQYQPGDRVAEFGLAALVAGGAAAVATKKGFWAVLAGFFAAAWKLVAAAVVGVVVWAGQLFKRKS